MNKQEILRFAETIEGAMYDYPFSEDFETAVLRHADTKKWFGIVLAAPNASLGKEPAAGQTEVLNLKVPPELSLLLRENYRGVLPAYHMNKTHWITVVFESDVPDGEVRKLLELSFDITGKRSKE